MFNKSSIFPKPADTPPRGGRLVPGTGAAAGSVPLSPLGQTEPVRPKSDDTPAQHTAAVQASAPSVADSASDSKAQSGDSRLIVGPDVKLKGAEILDCDTLVVEGRVEATMDSRVIRIAEHGAFSGTVGIDVAEIHGRFDGELTARSQLIIHATGRVSGKIRYGKIFIEEGGEISGDIRALDAADGLKRVGASAERGADSGRPPIAAAG